MNNLQTFIKNIIKEDIGQGDHTSLSCIKKTVFGEAKLICKEESVLAGVELVKMICNYYFIFVYCFSYFFCNFINNT